MRPSQPTAWQRRLAPIVGYLSLSIEKRKLSRELLLSWATILRLVADEMEKAAAS